MNEFLDNPVYHALISGDSSKALGTERVKFFDTEISPFAGFLDNYKGGFDELYELLPAGRKILYATRREVDEPSGWKQITHIEGSQFLYLSKNGWNEDFENLVALDVQHIDQMVALAALTKPGPFGSRTIEFGNYHGVFDGDKLVAMTGRRLHIYGYIEVSAVCTHPDYLGRGYAQQLLKHEVNSILKEKKVPFLHVRADNKRAIDLYERLGFVRNGKMNFYLLSRT